MKPLGKDEGWFSAEHRFAPDHPTAAGHFPGNPIIPGALLLDHILRAIGQPLTSLPPWEIRVVKFIRPVRPGDTVTIRWQPGPNGGIAFECRFLDGDSTKNGERALAGSLTPRAA